MDPGSSNNITQSVEDLEKDFHNTLLSKVMTQYIPSEQGFRYGSTGTMTKLKRVDPMWPWRRFLDQLCGLCCFDKAGDAVLSLGVQNCGDHVRFWVTANDLPNANKGANHLRRLFKHLVKAQGASDLGEFARQICRISVDEAAPRVKEYRRKMRLTLEDLKKQLDQNKNEEGISVYRALRDILKASYDPWQDTSRAYSFSKDPTCETLDTLAVSEKGIYLNLRHLLGRLCLWHNAACFVTERAKSFEKALVGAEVMIVPQKPSTSPIDIPETVEGAFARVFGQHHPMAATAGQKLHYCQLLLDNFRKHSQLPVAHAEASMANHFSSYGLPFAYNDSYIACSKPSCYSCSLYMRALPMTFVDRPHHGNAWLRWGLPKSDQASAQQDAQILRDMASFVRRDVELCIAGEKYGRRQQFESTTGMSGPVLEL